MPTVALSQLLDIVLPYAPAAPHPVAITQLRQSAIDLCKRTKIWRHIFDPITITGNNFAPSAPAYATIYRVESARFNDTTLYPVALADVDALDLDDSQDRGVPMYITQVEPNRFSIAPYAAGTLYLTAILRPVDSFDPQSDAPNTMNVIPDWMATNYGQTICHGALAQILKMPNQPYTDPGLARDFEQRFERAVSCMSSDGVQGQQRAPLRSVPHSF